MIRKLKKARKAASTLLGVASSFIAASMVSVFFLAHKVEELFRRE